MLVEIPCKGSKENKQTGNERAFSFLYGYGANGVVHKEFRQ
jgi:hypothetical protein